LEKVYRIIDANINRISEGLRVLEDLARFYYQEAHLTEQIKMIRHRVRKTVNGLYLNFLNARDSENDPGLDISRKSNLDNKNNLKELIVGNFKRIQEGLRVIEENLKVIGQYELSKVYESCRYDIYTIEKIYLLKFIRLFKKHLLNTDLYCITAEEYSLGRSNIEVVQAMIDAGVKIIQYREKDKKMLDKYKECQKIRELTRQAGVTFIINDDVDLALLVGADGIHIGQEDLPMEKVRELVGEEMIIGLSTHSPSQAQDAVAKGADYIGVGPIFKTYTKKDVCDPVGFEYLEYVVQNIDIPFVAIGGIKQHNVAEVVKRGATCVAMVTEIVGADDISEKIKEVRRVIAEAKASY